MINEILIKRICKLISVTYAISEDTIWQSYLIYGSIDKILEEILNGNLK